MQQPPQSPTRQQPTPVPQPKTTTLYPVGHCTQCGAPIWARPTDAVIDATLPATEVQAPPIWHSCNCRPGSLIPRRPGSQANKARGIFSLEFQEVPEPLQGLLALQRAEAPPDALRPALPPLVPERLMGPTGTAVMPQVVPGMAPTDPPDWLNDLLSSRARQEANAPTEVVEIPRLEEGGTRR
jgi:hypothetical protein